jgi:REP element-mobilizing transposase RayT
MRKPRPYLPGAVFHLTARTQGKEHWFDEPMRDQIVAIIADALPRTDAQLLAYVIMSNHLHLVVRQGIAPLAQLMQPICRRTALAVQRAHQRKGHVFEGRYRVVQCADEKHVRNAIVYTHLNPCNASLCDDPAAYPWSSHLAYCGESRVSDGAVHTVGPKIVPWVNLFAPADHDRENLPHAAYQRYVESKRASDPPAHDAPPTSPELLLLIEEHSGPDGGVPADAGRPQCNSIRPDLRDLVLSTLREVDPPIELDLLRMRRYGRAAAAVRRIVIERAIRAGYRGVQIARFLHVSEATVSKVATATFGRPNVRFER